MREDGLFCVVLFLAARHVYIVFTRLSEKKCETSATLFITSPYQPYTHTIMKCVAQAVPSQHPDSGTKDHSIYTARVRIHDPQHSSVAPGLPWRFHPWQILVKNECGMLLSTTLYRTALSVLYPCPARYWLWSCLYSTRLVTYDRDAVQQG